MTSLFPSIAKTPWQPLRWPNFRAKEIACDHGQCVYCDGEVWLDEDALDALQRMRTILNAPIEINSGHRCPQHNRSVGGARHSAHLELAFDISLARHARPALFAAAREAGFRHFGFMNYALHVDMRPLEAAAEFWTYGDISKELWRGIVPATSVDIGGD